MKKLKKVLLIGLFSFLFIVNVNASIYIRNDFPDFSSYVGSNNYVIVYHYFGENSSSNRFTLVYCNNDALLSTKYLYNGTSTAGSEYKCSSGYLLQRNLLYNSKVFTSFNAQSLYNRNFNFNNGLYSWGSEYSSRNGYVVGAEIYSDKTRLRILSDLEQSGVIYTENDIYYSDNINVILSKNIFGSKLNDLGTFNNSNVLTYKIKDEEPGKDKELKLKFTFLNQLDITGNDITIYKYGSQVYTEYSGTTCTNDGNNSVCELSFEYDVYDSIDDKLMFDFKFNNSYNVKVEDNSGSNGVYSNYKDVEFEYKIINLKEKSSVLFYLRNYDNFDYINDFYSSDELGFSFYSSHPSTMLFNNIIYPHDIRYNNTYFFKDSNDYYNVYVNSLNKLNNFGYLNIPFNFDYSLLNDNKFSSFYINNPNYLGSDDVDNQDLYISYNSSLFNFSTSSVIYNNSSGSFVPGISFDDNIDFIINGNQENIESNPDNWFATEFDEEIKVQYKSGLQYFKDKIINMFEFVSEFYNTMPNKFQVAFSLIFVLLIGIGLFRLML